MRTILWIIACRFCSLFRHCIVFNLRLLNNALLQSRLSMRLRVYYLCIMSSGVRVIRCIVLFILYFCFISYGVRTISMCIWIIIIYARKERLSNPSFLKPTQVLEDSLVLLMWYHHRVPQKIHYS